MGRRLNWSERSKEYAEGAKTSPVVVIDAQPTKTGYIPYSVME